MFGFIKAVIRSSQLYYLSYDYVGYVIILKIINALYVDCVVCKVALIHYVIQFLYINIDLKLNHVHIICGNIINFMSSLASNIPLDNR